MATKPSRSPCLSHGYSHVDERYYIPPPPRGRWVWIPDQVPQYGCPACANGGVCMCVRPDQGPTVYCPGTDTRNSRLQ